MRLLLVVYQPQERPPPAVFCPWITTASSYTITQWRKGYDSHTITPHRYHFVRDTLLTTLV